MKIFLADSHATQILGRNMAACLVRQAKPLPVFFRGSMGMGKTTLITALAKALPGGEDAETGSPGFTVCNVYPTKPGIAHFDFYRLGNGMLDESLLDFLDEERHLVLVEWAERVPAHALPPDRLDCLLTSHGGGRLAEFAAYGLALPQLSCLRSLAPGCPGARFVIAQ
jgi:tRNA threonylcarbamoyladenosine biosynthesis protein TsaE